MENMKIQDKINELSGDISHLQQIKRRINTNKIWGQIIGKEIEEQIIWLSRMRYQAESEFVMLNGQEISEGRDYQPSSAASDSLKREVALTLAQKKLIQTGHTLDPALKMKELV